MPFLYRAWCTVTPTLSDLHRFNFKALMIFLSLCVFSHFKIFQTSALLIPVTSGVWCAARTRRATSCVTVLQAGQEPDARKVLSSLWKERICGWTLCTRPQQRLSFCRVTSIQRICKDVITVTLIFDSQLLSSDRKVSPQLFIS